MTNFNSLFSGSLSSNDRLTLAQRLSVFRQNTLQTSVAKAAQTDVLARLKGQAPKLRSFLAEFHALISSDSNAFARVAGHWSTGFLLRRISQRVSEEELSCAIDALNGVLMASRTGGNCMSRPQTGQMATGHTAVDWLHERRRQIRSRDEADPLEEPTDDQSIPVARIPVWDVPVFEPEDWLGGGVRPETASFMPVSRSLPSVQRVLQKTWPEVGEWVNALVPAFMDIGNPPAPDVHISESGSPGLPIILGRVNDPWLHVEDVVHELQHLRIAVLSSNDSYPDWNDNRARFVSPWRTDPRPLRGILKGLHAFLAVNRLRILAIEQLRKGSLSISRTPERLISPTVKSHLFNMFAFRTLVEHFAINPSGQPLFDEMAKELAKQHAEIDRLDVGRIRSDVTSALSKHVAGVQQSAAEPIVSPTADYYEWDRMGELANTYFREARYAH